MKRLVTLAVLCAFVFGMAATASAADIKATGSYAFEAIWSDMNFDDDGDADSDFDVYQRLRTKFEFIANENLKGVLYTEVGTSTWGSDTMEVGEDITDGITLKAGYIDFNWPGTQQNIKVGHYHVDLPAAVGGASIILADELPTAVISGPITDNVAYMFGWHRLEKSEDVDAELDAVSAALPLTFDGVSVTPFVLAAWAGDAYTYENYRGLADDDADVADRIDVDVDNAWWAGVAFEMTMFDPFVFKADLNYGRANVDRTSTYGTVDDDPDAASGWFFDAALEYKGFDFMTPEVFFAWSSGDDDDDYATEGQMPLLPNAPGDWALGSFFFGGDWGLEGSIDNDESVLGFWTLGVSLKDISFFEGLTHTVNVMYIQGTNDDDNIVATGLHPTSLHYLTDDDSLWELDLNSAYSIYDELTAYVELGWIAPDWADERDISDDDAWKISTGLEYSF